MELYGVTNFTQTVAHRRRVSALSLGSIDDVRCYVKRKGGCDVLSTSMPKKGDKIMLKCACGDIFDRSIPHIISSVDNKCPNCTRTFRRGRNAANWQGGKTPQNKIMRHSFEYRQWRSEVFTRDKYTCQCCGHHGGVLNAHHINNFSTNEASRLDVNNGITLCYNCHSINVPGSFHRMYGVRNNTREQLDGYIRSCREQLNLGGEKAI